MTARVLRARWAAALLAVGCGATNDGGHELCGAVIAGGAEARAIAGGTGHARGLLTAGAGHTCVVASDARVYCWGSNPDGQLGDGTQSDRSRPAPVLNVEHAIAVAAGSYHACALISDGSVRCWGWNVAGQVGDNTRANRLSAVPVSGLTGATAIATGSYHSCAIVADGRARCWGQNDSGQLGDGSMIDRPSPVDVFSLPPSVALAASGRHTCALTAAGEVQCWGGNELGELGDGTTEAHAFPAPVIGLGLGLAGTMVAVRAGFNHTCALGTLGDVWCWGANANGQLGVGDTADRATPSATLPGEAPMQAIASGYRHTCEIDVEGRVSCWGWNDAGQIGDGSTSTALQPGPPLSELPTIEEVTGGGFHTCARTTTGGIFCWGANESGQLGRPAWVPGSAARRDEWLPALVDRFGC